MELQFYDDRFLIGIQTKLSHSFSANIMIITQLWHTFQQKINAYHLQQKKPFIKYGLTFRRQDCLYYACTIPATITYPDDFQIYQLPRNEYLLYMHHGTMKKLPSTINYLMKDYMPANSYVQANTELIYYEAYDYRFDWNADGSSITIGIPLQWKHDQHTSIPAKTILQGNGVCNDNWSWFGMDYNMNLYKGCNHGCIYCDSRSNCYQVTNFDWVRTKQNELLLLESELKRKKRKGVVGIGAMSDTYNPLEQRERITHGALSLLLKYGYGVGIDTKSDLILEDLELIKNISINYPSIVKLTITCADDDLCKIIEPHAPVSSKRFDVLEELHTAGIYAGILLMPILPFINDTIENITSIVRLAHEHHAKFIYPGIGVTLRENQRSYFYKQLDQYFPGKRLLYEKHYHNTYSCTSLHAKELYKILYKECDRYGIKYHMRDIINAYKIKQQQQLSLLI